MKQLLTLTCFLLLSLFASAQRLAITCKVSADSVQLRWAATNPEAWSLGNRYGFDVERVTIFRGNRQLIPVETISLATIRPQNIDEWERYEEDGFCAMAAECIFGNGENEIEDRGLVMNVYKKHQQWQQRFGYALFCADQSLDCARLSGLYFCDLNVKKGEKYVYKITFHNADSLSADTAFCLASMDSPSVMPKVSMPLALSCNNKVSLKWSTAFMDMYVSYYVERSDDGGKTFRKLNASPIASTLGNSIIFDDTTAVNGENYSYRVYGKDCFGSIGPRSDVAVVSPTGIIEKMPLFSQCGTGPDGVSLGWDYQAEENVSISGFRIYRSKKVSDKPELLATINDPKACSYLDKNPRNVNYYYLSVFNDSGERINPFPEFAHVIDSTPPVKPFAPVGFCDSLGIVHLSWPKSKDDDLRGYRVFVADNAEDQRFMLTSKVISDTMFLDTINLNTLSKKYHYCIKAVDENDNQSEFSDLCQVAVYDTIAPRMPRMKTLEHKNNKVYLEWTKSPSDDVVNYLIMRKMADGDRADTLQILKNSALSFVDETAVAGYDYHYLVVAVDENGNCSGPSIKPIYIPMDNRNLPKLTVRKQMEGVALHWKPVDCQSITIYRGKNGKSISSYMEIGQDQSFTDSDVTVGNKYSYRIRINYPNGESSALSNEASLEM